MPPAKSQSQPSEPAAPTDEGWSASPVAVVPPEPAADAWKSQLSSARPVKAPAALADVSKLQDDPRYEAARLKLIEIQLRRDDLDRRIENLHAQAAMLRRNRRESEAHQLVYGVPAGAAEPTIDPMELAREREMLGRAAELAQVRLHSVIQTISKEIVRKVGPHYLTLLRKMHAAGMALAALVEEEKAFWAALESAGVQAGNLTRISLPVDNDRMSFYRNECDYYFSLDVKVPTSGRVKE